MKIRYDKEADAMYIYAEKGVYEVSEEVGDGLIIDISKDGKIIGLEILDASEKFSPQVFKNITLNNWYFLFPPTPCRSSVGACLNYEVIQNHKIYKVGIC